MRKKVLCLIIMLFISFNVYAENEATLKNIKVNGRECSCSSYECNVEVSSKKATVTYELNDSEATTDRLSGFSVDLEGKVTVVKIVVSNNKGEQKIENTYNISITLHEKSGDYTLKELKVKDDKLELKEDVYVYNYEAEYSDEELTITAVPNDNNAKVKLEEVYKFPLDRSSISFDFDVIAENGEEKTYRIFMTRGKRPDTSLASLKLDHGNIIFNKDTLEYKFTVPYEVNDLIIEAIANDDKANVKIEKEDLVVGENVVKIIVTNEKASSEYVLNVTREENMDKSQANLKSLTILEYPNFHFEENVLDYTLVFKDIPKKLTISAKSNLESNIEIMGNENLQKDGKIIIKNTLIDSGITREYALNIQQKEEEEESNWKVIICLIVVIITIILMLILEIKERKRTRHLKLTRILELKKKKDKDKKAKKENKVKKDTKKKEDDLEII